MNLSFNPYFIKSNNDTFATRLQHISRTFAPVKQKRSDMADKIKKSYKFSKSFYDDAITQGKWWVSCISSCSGAVSMITRLLAGY